MLTWLSNWIRLTRKYGLRYTFHWDWQRKVRNRKNSLRKKLVYGSAWNSNRHGRINTLVRLYGNKCAYCRRKLSDAEITLDHIIGRAEGGSNHISNLQIMCAACNQLKNKLSQKPKNYALSKLKDIYPVK